MFDRTGKFVRRIAHVQLKNPNGIEISEGTDRLSITVLHLADVTILFSQTKDASAGILSFQYRSGALLARISSHGTGDGQIGSHLCGLRMEEGSGHLLIGDHGNDRVEVRAEG